MVYEALIGRIAFLTCEKYSIPAFLHYTFIQQDTCNTYNKEHYMAVWIYELYFLVLSISLTRSLHSLVRDIGTLENIIRISSARPCNILYNHSLNHCVISRLCVVKI